MSDNDLDYENKTTHRLNIEINRLQRELAKARTDILNIKDVLEENDKYTAKLREENAELKAALKNRAD